MIASCSSPRPPKATAHPLAIHREPAFKPRQTGRHAFQAFAQSGEFLVGAGRSAPHHLGRWVAIPWVKWLAGGGAGAPDRSVAGSAFPGRRSIGITNPTVFTRPCRPMPLRLSRPCATSPQAKCRHQALSRSFLTCVGRFRSRNAHARDQAIAGPSCRPAVSRKKVVSKNRSPQADPVL